VTVGSAALESWVVIEYPTYEFANDLGSGFTGGSQMEVWVDYTASTNAKGSIHLGDDTKSPKIPAAVKIRGMGAFTAN